MGFWMQFVRPPTKLPKWYEPLNPEYPDLYDLTFEGMREVAAAMSVAFLLDEKTPAPQLPRWGDVGLSPERGQELFELFVYRPKPGQQTLDDVLTPEERPAFIEYLARFEAATGQPAPPGQALGYKFRTNDGWLVTPDECRVIAHGLDEDLADHRDDLIRGLRHRGYSRTLDTVRDLLVWWAQYNRVAADHGGYGVW
jgi:hypothetical protein